MRNAIVITFDELPLRLLGCYGNDWVESPNFDALATESVVFDGHFTDVSDADHESVAAWTGRHHLQPAGDDISGLGTRLRNLGVRCELLTDAPTSALPTDFDAIHPAGVDSPVSLEDLGAEALSRCDADKSIESPRLLWLKCRGASPDALVSLLEASELPDDLSLMQSAIEDGFGRLSTSERTRVRELFGMLVTLIDDALGRLLDELADRELLDDMLLIVAGSRGVSLGESADARDLQPDERHSCPAELRDEIVRLPLFVRLPDEEGNTRRADLVQSTDVASTILDWFGDDPAVPAFDIEGRSLLRLIRDDDESLRRDAVVICGSDERSLRSRDFQLVSAMSLTDGGHENSPLLFSKPDDRWDLLDVADRDPDIVADLADRLRTAVSEAGAITPP